MIARVWRGRTEAAKADEYFEYLKATGLSDYRSVEGNRGVRVLRRIEGVEAEFLLISFWDSLESIAKFAGEDVERAVYYPDDRIYLLELEPKVSHYEVMFAS